MSTYGIPAWVTNYAHEKTPVLLLCPDPDPDKGVYGAWWAVFPGGKVNTVGFLEVTIHPRYRPPAEGWDATEVQS